MREGGRASISLLCSLRMASVTGGGVLWERGREGGREGGVPSPS